MRPATHRRFTGVVSALAITTVLRWLILTHSVPPGQPWRTTCQCGQRLWPGACGPTGRCHACGIRTGPPSYLIEAATITTAVAVAVPAQGTLQTIAALWWTAGAVVLAAVDASVRRLPHRITAATAAGFLALLSLTGDGPALARAVVAATLVVAVFTVAALLRPGQLGFGDVGLTVPVSAFLSAHSWMTLLHGYLAGFAAAVTFLAAARITRRPKRTVPLGPFLLAGALFAAQT